MLESIASRLNEGRKIILIHGNADPDALGSAYALYRSFSDMTIAAPGGLDRLSKIIAEKLDLNILENISLDDYDQVVVLDTSSPDQLGKILEIPEGTIVIDHHTRSSRWEGCLYYCDETKRSCAEIIVELLEVAGKDMVR